MEYKYHLNWEDHDWEKLNLVSKSCPQGLYDEYGCKCGAWAHRYGVGDLVSHKNFRSCKTKIEPTIEGYTIGVKAVITDRYAISAFGFEPDKIYESCEGTDSNYMDDLWFMSPTRNEPIRLFSREYRLIIN